MKKPEIIVLSADNDDEFQWLSGGWNSSEVCHTDEAKQLFARAKQCISDGTDVKDVVRRLEEAGFKITRDYPKTKTLSSHTYRKSRRTN